MSTYEVYIKNKHITNYSHNGLCSTRKSTLAIYLGNHKTTIPRYSDFPEMKRLFSIIAIAALAAPQVGI